MQLLGSDSSPFVRKVRIALLEKNIPFTLQPLSAWRDPAAVNAVNPLGKLPVLVDGSDVVFDSRVILEYLELRVPDPALIATQPRERLAALQWQALADGISEAVILQVQEGWRAAERRSETWRTRQATKVALGLAHLDRHLADRTWLDGSAFSVADIATAAALGVLRLWFPDDPWPTSHVALAAYEQRLLARDAVRSTVPQPVTASFPPL